MIEIFASDADRWARTDGCTGSVELSRIYRTEKDKSESALAHELCKKALDESPKDLENWLAANATFDNDELLEACAYFITEMRNQKAQCYCYKSFEFMNIKVVSRIHGFCVRGRTLNIFKFKTGFIPVPSCTNYELVTEAMILLQDLSDIDRVIFSIIQPLTYPKFGPHNVWDFSRNAIYSHILDIKENLKSINAGNVRYHAGDNCRYCPGLSSCSTAFDYGLKLFETAKLVNNNYTSPDELSYRLTLLKHAKHKIDQLLVACEEAATHKIQNKFVIPGYKLQSTKKPLSWKEPPKYIFKIGDEHGINLRKEASAITPTQAKAKFKKSGLDPDIINSYSERVDGPTKLVKDENNYKDIQR